ncbi:hypothetical protein EYC59_05645 [Candidatus Saccharibacteria bacterium]|nr:MAG: hypothetical protein EYC59_05645 [Candidatus Saccharibacteria bacterium]
MGMVVVLSVSALSIFIPKQASAFSGSGAGTAGDPYKITSCAELLDVNSDLAAHYELAGSIDCDGETMSPIGYGSPFTGTFDGKGNEIKNVTIDVSPGNVGVFGDTDGATITDVRLTNIDVTGQYDVGGLVGHTYYTTISYISGQNITVHGPNGSVGGLVGQLGGSTLSKSSVEAVSVTSAGTYVGGLVGEAVGPTTVYDSYAAGTVNGSGSVVGGVVGKLGAVPAFAERLYADISFTTNGSQPVGTVGSGASTSSTFMASAPYLANHTVAPLDSWDFDAVWYVRPAKYPGLRPHTLPIRLCNMPSSTNTSITASCTSDPLLEGDPHWELKYGFDDEPNTTTTLTTQAGQSFNVTVSSLLPGTDYAVYFRYVDAVGTSPWGKVQVTTTGSSDVDNDNVSNEEEARGPHGGDANNDGTADYTQANVTSFKSAISGNYVSLQTACTDNFDTQLGLESTSQKDATYDYPAGLMGFVIRGCTLGATTPVSIYFYGSYNPADYIARKGRAGVYSTVPGATFTSATIGGQSALKLTYSITDGGALDDDGTADGNIVDPVGLAVAATSAAASGTSGGAGTLVDTGLGILTLSGVAAALIGAAFYIWYRPTKLRA